MCVSADDCPLDAIRNARATSHHLQQRLRHFGRRRRHADARLFEGGDLGGRRAFAAADNGAGMAHAPARRGGGARR